MTPDLSQAYDLLHPEIQRWIYRQKWTGLSGIQEQAIPCLIEGENDAILSAGTSSGKTEAAMLPILTRIASDGVTGSIRATYVGPLKALINDQFLRLEDLCKSLDIPVTKWHGDASASGKRRVREDPSGVLLITPESLEALFVHSGPSIPRIFSGLAYVIIDELHAFIGTERGRQLQSQLHRIDLAVRRRVPRVGLSATLSDMSIAAEFLRPGRGEHVTVLSPRKDSDIQMQVKGYEIPNPKNGRLTGELPEGVAPPLEGIVEHLYKTLRGTNNLIFANSRANVEIVADKLRQRSEDDSVPMEFFPHHGKLSKDLRESLEATLKQGRPVSAVCTSTLEMGIDIGSVKSVAQVGVPPSVAALRQRLGRSGRRDDPSVLRIYIEEMELEGNDRIVDRLRLQLVQAIAMADLIVERWCEPPAQAAPHFSTLVHQILSLIAQHGGVRATEAYGALCKSGPFSGVTVDDFAELLRALGMADLIVQAGDGTLLCGKVGEQIVNHYTFFAAFQTEEEFRLVHQGRTLGTLPINIPIKEGDFLIFGGRRWRIIRIHDTEKLIELTAAPAGRAVASGETGGDVHDRVRRRMRDLLSGVQRPKFLDRRAWSLLQEARVNYGSLRLWESSIVQEQKHATIVAWVGDRKCETLALALGTLGIEVALCGPILAMEECSVGTLQRALDYLSESFPDTDSLAKLVKNLRREKFDDFVPERLLRKDYGVRRIDVVGGQALAAALLRERDVSTA